MHLLSWHKLEPYDGSSIGTAMRHPAYQKPDRSSGSGGSALISGKWIWDSTTLSHIQSLVTVSGPKWRHEQLKNEADYFSEERDDTVRSCVTWD
jgi:hypothetical protein